MTEPQDTMRWIRRGGALVVLLIGWLFIAWQNHFHVTAPMVVVGIAYLAVVATIYNLWRTGAAAVDADDESDSTWVKPAGALGELEREKRTLLKAIKEAEFDHQMGKLSKRDADEMIAVYRARAIEVIKDIDRIAHGATGTPREQILREVRARLELEARSKKPGAKQAKAARAGGAAPGPQVTAASQGAAAGAGATATQPGTGDGAAPSQARAEQAAGAAQAAAPAAPEDQADAEPARPVLDDDAMNADSTTAVEPARSDPGKEATP